MGADVPAGRGNRARLPWRDLRRRRVAVAEIAGGGDETKERTRQRDGKDYFCSGRSLFGPFLCRRGCGAVGLAARGSEAGFINGDRVWLVQADDRDMGWYRSSSNFSRL